MKFVQAISLIAITEMQIARRSLRFRVIAPTLTLGLFTCYVLSCVVHLQFAPYIPGFASSIPLYLLGCIDPFLFVLVQFAVLMLIFDVDQRNSRCRISEVLGCKPISNIEFLSGRVVGCAMLIWGVVAMSLFACQLFGWFVQHVDSDFGWSFQVHSLFNLLFLDLPATLLIWGALSLLLGKLVRYRLLILPLSVLAMLGWYLLTTISSYEHLELFSASSNDSLFVSDLLPQIASLPSVAMRVGTVAFAAVLIGISAWMMKRHDESRGNRRMIALVSLSLIATASVALSYATIEHRINQVDDWRDTHEALHWEGELDVRVISGNVRIDPGSRLDIDLTLEFEAIGVNPPTELIFAFNPGFEISELQIDGGSVQFSFEKGVLRVQHFIRNQDGSVHTMHIVASGLPNPRFSYLDSHFDYLAEPGMPLEAIRSFGTDGSIFDKDYVALMPGTYWYPQPGPAFSHFGNSRSKTDYFNIDLSVELVRPNWRLVGPDVKKKTEANGNWFKIQPSARISNLALFASEFEYVESSAEGIELALYLHAAHKSQLEVLGPFDSKVTEWASSLFQNATEYGLNYPLRSLAVVEVPNRLRTIGGGWRADTITTLPGIVLLRERGLPVVRIARAFKQEEDLSDQFMRLFEYFRVMVGSDNVLKTMPRHFWSHATCASGPVADVLDQVVHNLIAEHISPFPVSSTNFNPYSASLFVTMTKLQFLLATQLGNARSLYLTNLRELEHEHIARPEVWDRLEDITLTQLPSNFGHQFDLHVTLLKSQIIAEALSDYHSNERDKIVAWLSSMHDRFAGLSYRYEDLLEVAREHEVMVDPFLTDWLTSSELPGFVASESTIVRIANSEWGSPRYQISFTVRNTQSITGLIAPVTNVFLRNPVLIGPNSAKKVNLVWFLRTDPTEIGYIPIPTSLSLNRSGLRVSIDARRIPEQLTMQPDPLAEPSDWKFARHGIIVDDLDPGFTVLQPKLLNRRFVNMGPAAWFLWPGQNNLFDGGLPYLDRYSGLPTGWWSRKEDSSAYGLYRRTYAGSWIGPNTNSHRARFSAEIPDSASWILEYHVYRSEFKLLQETTLKLRIDAGTNSWDVEFDVARGSEGWKQVGEFDLDAGIVNVDIVGVKEYALVAADAIRWTRTNPNTPELSE